MKKIPNAREWKKWTGIMLNILKIMMFINWYYKYFVLMSSLYRYDYLESQQKHKMNIIKNWFCKKSWDYFTSDPHYNYIELIKLNVCLETSFKV